MKPARAAIRQWRVKVLGASRGNNCAWKCNGDVGKERIIWFPPQFEYNCHESDFFFHTRCEELQFIKDRSLFKHLASKKCEFSYIPEACTKKVDVFKMYRAFLLSSEFIFDRVH